jgi:hypothetical protein
MGVPPGERRRGLPAQDFSHLVTQRAQNPENNGTAWRVQGEDRHIDPTTGSPKTLVGFVEISLRHRIGRDERGKECPGDVALQAADRFPRHDQEI